MRCNRVRIIVTGLLIVAFWCACQSISDSNSQSHSDTRNLSGLLEQQRKSQRLPSVAAAVVSRGKIVAQGVAGEKTGTIRASSY
jgi:hypothetical protein